MLAAVLGPLLPPAGAVESLEEAPRPDDPKAWLEQARSFRHQGRTGEAMEATRKALSASNFVYGQCLMLQGDVATSINYLEKAKPDFGQTGLFVYWMGKFYLENAKRLIGQGTTGGLIVGSFQDAAERFEASREMGYDPPTLYHDLAEAQYMSFQAEASIETLRAGVTRHPGEASLQIAVGDRYLDLYKTAAADEAEDADSLRDQAIEAFTGLMEGGEGISSHSMARAWAKLGETWWWAGDIDQARQILLDGIEAYPTESPVYTTFHQMMAGQNRMEELCQSLREIAFAGDRSNATAFWFLGYAQYTNRQFREAAVNFRRSVEKNPDFGNAIEYEAAAFAQMGYAAELNEEWERAASSYQKSLETLPGYWGAIAGFDRLGGHYVEEGNDAAREYFRGLVDLGPSHADWWNNYAFFCRETEHYEASYEAYVQAMALAPDDPRIINDTALILLYHLERSWDEAEALFLEAYRKGLEQYESPETSQLPADEALLAYTDALENLTLLYIKQKRLEEGLDVVTRLLEIQPDREMARRYLDQIHEELDGVKANGGTGNTR